MARQMIPLPEGAEIVCLEGKTDEQMRAEMFHAKARVIATAEPDQFLPTSRLEMPDGTFIKVGDAQISVARWKAAWAAATRPN